MDERDRNNHLERQTAHCLIIVKWWAEVDGGGWWRMVVDGGGWWWMVVDGGSGDGWWWMVVVGVKIRLWV